MGDAGVYGVMFVQDDELPTMWALVRFDGRTRLFIRESSVTPEVLEQAWAAYRKSVGIPEQRTSSLRSVASSAVASG